LWEENSEGLKPRSISANPAAITSGAFSPSPRRSRSSVARYGVGAARGHKSDLLPVPRSEYLALDVVAFEIAGDRRWRFPVGVFELENSPVDDLVAYSLWKVLCVRANLRVVFCYRRDATAGAELVRHLADQVVQAMEIPTRSGLGGETLVIVGSRNETATFPYGFFKVWLLDTNTARFRRN
jgi:hypothetical protein